MLKHFKNILMVGSLTLGCRILGLFRDMLTFGLLGASGLNSAFIFAFTLPNLFRRLLGEGALTSAFIPIFTEELEHTTAGNAFRFLNQSLSWLLLVLCIVTGIGIGVFSFLYAREGLEERWYEGAKMGMILFPYVILVCQAAIMGAALNVLGKFGIPALSVVWLNLAMIASMLFTGYYWPKTPWGTAWGLCMAVLVGGIIQVVIPMIFLIRMGWRPSLDFSINNRIRELVFLFVPAVLGASILQVNVVVSRFLAFDLNESATSILYLANRLMELPLGVFTIAVTTVVFPNLAKMIARKDQHATHKCYSQGMHIILAITLPAAVGLIVLCEPILKLLFGWGRFDAEAIAITIPVVSVFALGIPFYSLSMFATRGFHAMKDTKTPVKVAMYMFFINIAISLLLMNIFGTVGLAIASFLTTVMQSILLQLYLQKKDSVFKLLGIRSSLYKVVAAAIIMGVIAYWSWKVLSILGQGKWMEGLVLILVIPLSALVYWVFLGKLGFKEYKELHSLFRRFKN